MRSRPLLLLLGGLVLASQVSACSAKSESSAGSDAPSSLDTVTLQLDWVPNTNHTGIYVADELGYYAEAGIKLEILPYASGVGDTLVSEGKADFAVSFQNSITLSKPAGADVTTVAAVVQHATDAIGVRADRTDIQSPADLDGKLYAGFGAPYEVPLLQSVIKAAGGTGQFETVVLDTAAYEAVYNGTADFVIPFTTWEGIEAKMNDEPFKYFDYSDYGVPDQYSVILIGNPQWLKDHADLAKRFLAATRKGYEYGAGLPGQAAKLLIEANPGVFTNTELVSLSQALMASQFLLDGKDRWGCITADQFNAYSSWLYDAGIIADANGKPITDEPDWSTFYDMSYLDCS